jgi:DNA-directed RNA polymerase specialized sigma24 family protein
MSLRRPQEGKWLRTMGELSQENLEKMDILLRLLAITLVNGKKQREQIRLLSLAGMAPKEIANLIGTSPNTVNVALSALRKAKRMNLKSEGESDG